MNMPSAQPRSFLIVLRVAAALLAAHGSSSHSLAGAFVSAPSMREPSLGRAFDPRSSRPILSGSSAFGCNGFPNATKAVLLMTVACAAFRHSPGARHPKKHRLQGARAALVKTQESSVLDHSKSLADLDEMADTLRKEADLLRADAAELEAEVIKQQHKEQHGWFQVFDTNRSGQVDVNELQIGWQELTGRELNHSMASRLLRAHDKNGNGVLEFEEFDTKQFQATLERLWAEDEAAQLALQQQEEERNAKLEAERQLKEYYERLPGYDDTGFVTRMLSVAAYSLPILDVAKFGLVLAFFIPPLMPLLDNLIVAQKTLGVFSIVVFLAMQWFASKSDLPASLRFNLYQAIRLDICLVIPTILWDFGENVDGNVWVVCCTLFFVLVTACIMYSVVGSLQGTPPRSIPYVSEWAEQDMGLKRPDVEASAHKDERS